MYSAGTGHFTKTCKMKTNPTGKKQPKEHKSVNATGLLNSHTASSAHFQLTRLYFPLKPSCC